MQLKVYCVKVTRVCALDRNEHTDFEQLDQLMRVFCCAVRYSFNRLIEGTAAGELIKRVNALFRMNKRYAEDAVMQAKAIVTSQQELLPIRIEGVQGKIQKTMKKLEDYQTGKKKPKKVSLELCLQGLHSRLEKLQAKEFTLLTYQKNKTIPPVIFGGKKQFYERLEQKISKEEWRELRSNTLYSRGDKSKKGNLNTRIVWDEENQHFYLEVADPLAATGKNSPRLRFQLHVPDKYYDEFVDVVMPAVIGYTPKGKAIETYKVYSVELKRKQGRYYAHITYDIETHGVELKWNEPILSDLVAGIDVNLDKVAVSIVTKQGNLLESKTFYCHEMEYVKSNRRSNIAGEIAKEIIGYLLHLNVGAIVLEDIHFKQTHDTNKKFNRLTHSFAKKKLQDALVSRGIRFGYKIKKVNPAYTSVIGRFKYSKMYGLSVHEAASFVIGRRGLDFEENIPKKLLQELYLLVKPYLIGILGSMEESEKHSNNGKQRRKYIGMMLNNINTWKDHHSWKLWNVVHKTLRLENQELQLKEV